MAIPNIVAILQKSLPDAVVLVTYRSLLANPAYDLETGIATPSYTDQSGVRAVLTRAKRELASGQFITPDGKRMTIAAADLAATPKVQDLVLISTETFVVHSVSPSPEGSHVGMEIRRVRQ